MKRIAIKSALLVAMLLVGLVTGCKKKEAASEPTADAAAAGQTAAQNTQSQEIMAALDKKDYDTVVSGLVKAKQAASTPQEETAAAGLIDDVKIRLIELAPTDPKAAEALNAIRQLSRGH